MRTNHQSVCAVLLLTLTTATAATGCGLLGDKDGATPSASGSSAAQPGPIRPGSTGPGGKVFTRDQLLTAALTDKDVPATYTISDIPDGPAPAADDPKCTPLMGLLAVNGGAERPAGTASYAIKDDRRPAGITGLVMASFQPAQAQAVMTRGSEALKNCASFTGTGPDGKATYKAAPIPSPRYGEATVAVKLTTTAGATPQTLTTEYIVVRVGATLIEFAYAEPQGTGVVLPADELVKKQVEKIQAASLI